MAEVFDNLHYNSNQVDSRNTPFNFVISAREPGKSTWFWFKKMYKAFKEEGKTSLVIRRKVVHITQAYIEDIAKIINKFSDDNITFTYRTGSIKDGIVDIYIDKKHFFRIVALSIDITAIKSLVIRNLKYILFDEFICNPKFKEKYLSSEVDKFFEIYNTFRRESDSNLKCYFLGNPYSLFNPYFVHFKISTANLKPGVIISDNKLRTVEFYKMKEELKMKILASNPLYKFDEDDYIDYAFEGAVINDKKIYVIPKKPDYFELYQLFKYDKYYLCIYRNTSFEDYYNNGLRFYCEELTFEPSKRRAVYCFDINDLVEGTILINNEDKLKFSLIKRAIQTRRIAFKTIQCYYFLEEIYKFI